MSARLAIRIPVPRLRLAVHYRMYEAHDVVPAVPTPRVLVRKADAGVVGAPFFVMEKIDGVIPSDRRRGPPKASSSMPRRAAACALGARGAHDVRAAPPPHERFLFLRTGRARAGSAIASTTDALAALAFAANRWPLAHQCEDWLLANSRRSLRGRG